ncbi:NADP-dependent oxidoreductase domain-containing protein [Flammula alnicola]|nr:NADP-dependent oxidoreductase domain-containing protein [Flammula alnicola]
MNEFTLGTKVKLRDGHEIPVLGYGTYELEENEAYRGVLSALEAGYRHIDSAAWYENEREVGNAILDFCRQTGTPREAIFYTTKLKLNNGYDNVKKAIQRSLDACRLGYIDLYLIHGPLGGPTARKESWRAICDFQKESGGLLRIIGISTFGIRHMKDIMQEGIPIPAVHQIDLHPFMTRPEIVAFSKQHGMVLEAWAPLVRGYRFEHPVLVALGQKYNKEAAQILLRYSLQKGYIPLPKSTSKSRIFSNRQIFDFRLSDEEVFSLDQLDEGLVTDWDPTDCA